MMSSWGNDMSVHMVAEISVAHVSYSQHHNQVFLKDDYWGVLPMAHVFSESSY